MSVEVGPQAIQHQDTLDCDEEVWLHIASRAELVESIKELKRQNRSLTKENAALQAQVLMLSDEPPQFDQPKARRHTTEIPRPRHNGRHSRKSSDLATQVAIRAMDASASNASSARSSMTRPNAVAEASSSCRVTEIDDVVDAGATTTPNTPTPRTDAAPAKPMHSRPQSALFNRSSSTLFAERLAKVATSSTTADSPGSSIRRHTMIPRGRSGSLDEDAVHTARESALRKGRGAREGSVRNRSGSISNGRSYDVAGHISYEISHDLQSEVNRALQRSAAKKFGWDLGSEQLNKAALVIQRAWRQYRVRSFFLNAKQRMCSKRLHEDLYSDPESVMGTRTASPLPPTYDLAMQRHGSAKGSTKDSRHHLTPEHARSRTTSSASAYASTSPRQLALRDEYHQDTEHRSSSGSFISATSLEARREEEELLASAAKDSTTAVFPWMPPETKQAWSMEELTRLNRLGVYQFNAKVSKGVDWLRDHGVVSDTPESFARFLLNEKSLNRRRVGEFLGETTNAFNVRVLHAYVDQIPSKGIPFDKALRMFLHTFHLPGEAQKIDMILEAFATKFHQQNPNVFAHADTAFVLSFSIVMLNTDLHNSANRNKMTKEQFVKNNDGINNGKNIPREYLEQIYDRIAHDEFKPVSDNSSQISRIAATINQTKITLELNRPHRQFVSKCAITVVEDYDKPKAKQTHKPRTAFLFNDVLLICKQHKKLFTPKNVLPLHGLTLKYSVIETFLNGLHLVNKFDSNVTLVSFIIDNMKTSTMAQNFEANLKEMIWQTEVLDGVRLRRLDLSGPQPTDSLEHYATGTLPSSISASSWHGMKLREPEKKAKFSLRRKKEPAEPVFSDFRHRSASSAAAAASSSVVSASAPSTADASFMSASSLANESAVCASVTDFECDSIVDRAPSPHRHSPSPMSRRFSDASDSYTRRSSSASDHVAMRSHSDSLSSANSLRPSGHSRSIRQSQQLEQQLQQPQSQPEKQKSVLAHAHVHAKSALSATHTRPLSVIEDESSA
eukprot:m.299280 g.299280  ORF g.299280 m.299280 type:complete len:1015 (+) comp15868_c2_seq5:601-3645(+)